MDAEYERSLLRLVDGFISSESPAESFRDFRLSFWTFYRAGRRRATWYFESSFPPELDDLHARWPDDIANEFDRLMNELLPQERMSFFDWVDEWSLETIVGEPDAQDRQDGYRSIGDFLDLLRRSRNEYRQTFGV